LQLNKTEEPLKLYTPSVLESLPVTDDQANKQGAILTAPLLGQPYHITNIQLFSGAPDSFEDLETFFLVFLAFRHKDNDSPMYATDRQTTLNAPTYVAGHNTASNQALGSSIMHRHYAR